MKPHVLACLVILGGAAAASCSSGSSPGGGSSSGSTSSSGGTSSSGSGSSGGDAASGDTWASWAQGFFATYCVECHAASDPTGRDFTQQSVVVTNQSTIRCGVCVQQDPSWNCPAKPPAKQFPISDSAGTNPKPTDAERNRVVAWITAGCP
jgi:hypothetical protein